MSALDELNVMLGSLRKKLNTAQNGFEHLENTEIEVISANCEKHGEYTKYKRTMNTGIKVLKSETDCPKCLEEQIEKIQEKIQKVDNQLITATIASLKAKSGIPIRFIDSDFKSYEVTEKSAKAKAICQKYANVWQERKIAGGGLILCGKPGTGKNHLACAIANQVIEQHQDYVKVTTALKIARNVKSTWSKSSEIDEEEMILNYCDPDLLIIDEIGVQFGSDAEKIILFEILNERYERMKPTILISNLSQSELGDYIGERVIDRMREGGGAVVYFDWESYRK